jgi:hypothetical protein
VGDEGVRTFAEDLAAAREQQRDHADPVWSVLRVVASEFGLESDPLDEVGVQGPWWLTREALPLAARLLAHGVGLTLREVGDRLGWQQTGNVYRPPFLNEYEVGLLERAGVVGRG